MGDSDWELSGKSTYSVERFYPSAGRQSDIIRVRMNTAQLRRIERMIASKKHIRIETLQDFVRDAVYHRLQYLESADPQTDDMLHQSRVQQGVADYEKEMATFTDTMERARNMVAELIRIGDRDRAAKKINEIRDDLLNINDPYWNKRYREEFQHSFPGMLKETV